MVPICETKTLRPPTLSIYIMCRNVYCRNSMAVTTLAKLNIYVVLIGSPIKAAISATLWPSLP